MGGKKDGSIFRLLSSKVNEYRALVGELSLESQIPEFIKHPRGCLLGEAGRTVDIQKLNGLFRSKHSIIPVQFHAFPP